MERFIIILLMSFSAITIFSCEKPEGCTDPDAVNFDPNAVKDNGTCKYLPTLTLQGNNEVIVRVFDSFVDAGATATNRDGSNVVVQTQSNVDTSVIGIYKVTYSATNENGTVTAERTVKVLADIGQEYGGGLFFYYLEPADIGYVEGEIHGLICAPSDHSTSAVWGCGGTLFQTSDLAGAGSTNTASIVSQCSDLNIAAKICNDLTVNGYSDWFLPSRKELNKLYRNLHLNGFGGFSTVAGDNYYWSSSEFNNVNAWYRYFATDYETTGSKSGGNLKVRAIRQF